ncbi:MAG: hypothetical protein GX417_07445 [Clostridiales bacterium]|nr:hypothetical protein [Clostridiales bacterium]
MSIFEMIMLICFGAAWPASLYRSYKSRSTKGKSVLFTITVIVGYIAGIIHKILYQYDFVLYLYVLNMAMATTDLLLWLRNRRLEKAHAAAESSAEQ